MFDLDEIKNISIKDVLKMYGIEEKKNFFSIRNEKTASCKLYDTTNSFYDFGAGVGGNVIDLVMYIENIDFQSAVHKIADMFYIDSISKSKSEELRDYEYIQIGINPTRVSANLDFDLDKFNSQQAGALSDKYNFPFRELKISNLKMYNKILKTKGYSFVIEKKKEFLNHCLSFISLNKKINSQKKDTFDYTFLQSMLSSQKQELENEIKELNSSFSIFNKAIDKEVFENMVFDEIIKDMESKDFKYQVGGISYRKLKELSENMASIIVPIEKYVDYSINLENVNYSAFMKDGNIKLIFDKNDLHLLENLFNVKKN